MRKDLRVGLGIGGVLVIVFIVMLMVHGRTSHKQQALKPVIVPTPDRSDQTDVTPPAGAPSDQPTPAGGSAEAPTAPPAGPTTTPTEIASTDHPGSDPFTTPNNFDALLNEGKDGILRSVTPAAALEGEGSGARAAVRGTGAGMTPGTLSGEVSAPGSGRPSSHAGAVRSTAPLAAGTHKVAQGETFSSIAQSVYRNRNLYWLIERANPNVDPTRLRPGQIINIPPQREVEHASSAGSSASTGASASRGSSSTSVVSLDSASSYTVRAGDSLYRIANRLYHDPSKTDAIYEANRGLIGPDRQRLKIGMVLKLPMAPVAGPH